MGEWTITGPTVLDVDDAIRAVDVRVVSGHVDLVCGDTDGAHLEVREIDGPPLRVTVVDGRLTIAHEDLHWRSLLGFRLSSRESRRAVVSVAVPVDSSATVGVVTADAIVAGLRGNVTVRCVSGDVTLDGTSGEVHVQTVSGDVELRDVTGAISLSTVSGGVTVVDGRPPSVHAKSVSGDVTLDLHSTGAVVVDVTTVSGDLTVRLPASTGLDVDVVSASGDMASSFEGVELSKRPGARRLTGRVGDGRGRLRGRSVSGRVALLASGQP
jgi:hypothetical protein